MKSSARCEAVGRAGPGRGRARQQVLLARSGLRCSRRGYAARHPVLCIERRKAFQGPGGGFLHPGVCGRVGRPTRAWPATGRSALATCSTMPARWARSFLATGHYAQVKRDEDGSYQLWRGADRAKDQSYVLHVLGQGELGRALFPVGRYTKPQVRALAGERGLPTASRAESQDLCFLADGDYRRFLRSWAPDAACPGPIVTGRGVSWAGIRGWSTTLSASAAGWASPPGAPSTCWRWTASAMP